jgi:hypothetical protein
MNSTKFQKMRKRNPEKGTALIELAILLPVLLLLVFVAIEGGAMLRTHMVINNAAREGARFGSSIRNMTGAQVTEVVTYYAQMNRVTIAPEEVDYIEEGVPGPNGTLMGAVHVTVRHPYTFNYLPVLPWGATSTQLLYGTAEFRKLY